MYMNMITCPGAWSLVISSPSIIYLLLTSEWDENGIDDWNLQHNIGHMPVVYKMKDHKLTAISFKGIKDD